MLDGHTVRAIAGELDHAERSRTQISQLSQRFPGLTIADAYAVQRAWIDLKRTAGRSVLGHKIGLTSRAMQQAVAITEPDHGVLLDDMFFDDGSEITVARFIEPRVEVELAFVLGREIGGAAVTLLDVLSATDYVVPAIEIIDARIVRIDPETRATRKVEDTISDNAADAGIILGGRPIRPLDLDLRWVGALLSKNGAIEETGVAAGVLNHPANGIAWLARRLSAYDATLAKGDVVLSGSFTRPIHVGRADVIHADYGALGTISCRFV